MPHYQEGTYDNVEIVGQGFTKSPTKGTPGFFITIRPGEYDRQITWWLPEGDKQEAAVDRMIASLTSLELPVDRLERFTQLDSRSASHVSFVGESVTVQCSYDTSGSKVYERWEAPFTGGGKAPEALDEKAIRQLDSLFGRKLKAAAGAKPAPKPTPKPKAEKPPYPDANAQPEQTEQTDNGDIPF